MIKGSCGCGDITFTVTGTPQGPSVCHCTLCRKMSGHTWTSAYVPRQDIAISGPVAWLASSPQGHRGICPRCGSYLFWEAHAEATRSFALGALDGPSGLTLEKHIFVADKGDYYAIADDLPQKE